MHNGTLIVQRNQQGLYLIYLGCKKCDWVSDSPVTNIEEATVTYKRHKAYRKDHLTA